MRRDPRELRRTLTHLAASAGGLFTASQALTAGYSYPSQHFHVRQGDWIRLDRGIYQLAGWPVDGRPDLVRWTLWSGGRGVISHDSALAIHDLGDVMPARTHMTLPPGVRKRTAALVLHRGVIPETDIEHRHGYQVTTPLRSLIDSAADHLEVDHLARAIGDASDRGLVTPARLRAEASATPASVPPIELALCQIGA